MLTISSWIPIFQGQSWEEVSLTEPSPDCCLWAAHPLNAYHSICLFRPLLVVLFLEISALMLSDTAATATSWSINNRALSRAAACLREGPGGLWRKRGLAAWSNLLALLDRAFSCCDDRGCRFSTYCVLRCGGCGGVNRYNSFTGWCSFIEQQTLVITWHPCLPALAVQLHLSHAYNILLVQRAAVMFSSGFKWLLGTWSWNC